MPWTEAARREHARRRPRYASDVNDLEWALIAPLLPPDRPQGRPRQTDLREGVNAILYMASTGRQWRMLPSNLPPPSTVQLFFYDWRDRGLWWGISNTLVMAARELEVRDAIARAVVTLPCQLRRSLAWEQGAEMARHAELRVLAGLPVYFCDPHSPWQRGTNENTNGLLRQSFPKGTDLSAHGPGDLEAVSATLDSRPRETLGWRTPAEALDEALRQKEADGVATTG